MSGKGEQRCQRIQQQIHPLASTKADAHDTASSPLPSLQMRRAHLHVYLGLANPWTNNTCQCRLIWSMVGAHQAMMAYKALVNGPDAQGLLVRCTDVCNVQAGAVQQRQLALNHLISRFALAQLVSMLGASIFQVLIQPFVPSSLPQVNVTTLKAWKELTAQQEQHLYELLDCPHQGRNLIDQIQHHASCWRLDALSKLYIE